MVPVAARNNVINFLARSSDIILVRSAAVERGWCRLCRRQTRAVNKYQLMTIAGVAIIKANGSGSKNFVGNDLSMGRYDELHLKQVRLKA